jgi:hypothetical protein
LGEHHPLLVGERREIPDLVGEQDDLMPEITNSLTRRSGLVEVSELTSRVATPVAKVEAIAASAHSNVLRSEAPAHRYIPVVGEFGGST